MPRRTHDERSGKRSRGAPERGWSSRQPRLRTHEIDAQALALREAGTSFSAIARMLELGRATDAHRCFVRALNAQEGDARRQLLANEEGRLDTLEQRIRERDANDATKIERRLRGVAELRAALEA